MKMGLMTNRIEPHRITKPIQLLAAWLVGLILTDSTLLTAARVIARPGWASAVLVVAAVAAIPLFLISIFLLQTKYRPEMQEDSYYSEYLKNSTTRMQIPAALTVEAVRRQVEESERAFLEAVRAVQTRAADLDSSLTEAPNATTPEMAAGESRLQDQIAEFVTSVNEVVDRTLKERVKIDVNDLLQRYPEIRDALQEAGYRIESTFGSTSQPPTTPKIFSLTATDDVPGVVFRDVFTVIKPFGLQSVQVTDERAFGTKLYVGGYAYEEDKVAPLSDALVATIQDASLSDAYLYDQIRRASTLGPLGE